MLQAANAAFLYEDVIVTTDSDEYVEVTDGQVSGQDSRKILRLVCSAISRGFQWKDLDN